LAWAACHGGFHDKALGFARAARRNATRPDLIARSHGAAGLALYFMGQAADAAREIRTGLAVPGIAPLERGKLLRYEGRLAIERFDLAAAERAFAGAREALAAAPPSADLDHLRAILGNNLWILESKRGNFTAAREALREGAPFLREAPRPLLVQYHLAWGAIESVSGRPREALAQAELGLHLLDPASDPFNAAVLVTSRGRAHLKLGNLSAAARDAGEARAIAVRTRFANVMIDATGLAVAVSVAQDNLIEARRELKEGIARLEKGISKRPMAATLNAQGLLALAERNWEDARECYAAAEEEVKAIPEYAAYARAHRVETEFLAGNPDGAVELAKGLPAPESLPGCTIYKTFWRILQALFAAARGEPEEARHLAEAGFAVDRVGEAFHSLAENALFIADSLKACRLGDKAPGLLDLCRRTAGEACEKTNLPAAKRRLEGPGKEIRA
ncbi:MAG: hypothetical protein V1809_04475, partial [Planctomycetota bacterium]